MAQYNKEIGEKVEEAYAALQHTMDDMTPDEFRGAQIVIDWFKNNYIAAGYKKLARKLVKGDINA